MRHRSIFAAVGLAIVLTTAGCAGVIGTSTGPGAGTPAEDVTTADGPADAADVGASGASRPSRTIEVGATGQVETQPDQVVLRVAVLATGESAAEVRRRVADNASRMRDALAGDGIERSRITTTHYDIDRNRRYGPREEDEPPFRARHAFAITLDEPDRAGEVIVTAVENGATSVDDVRFTLSEEKRRQLRKEALSDAVTSAREQAEVLAEGSDLSIAGTGSIRTSDVGFHRPRFEAAALAGGDGGGGTSIEGGSVTVTADVQVAYNATAA